MGERGLLEAGFGLGHALGSGYSCLVHVSHQMGLFVF